MQQENLKEMRMLDATFDPKSLNKFSMAFSLLVGLFMLSAFIINAKLRLGKFDMILGWRTPMYMMIALVVSIIVHELLHALAFRVLGKSKVKFGILMPQVMPYAHALTAMPIGAYRVALLLPNIILGVFPIIVGFILINGAVYFVGVVMLLSGIGDYVVFMGIRPYPTTTLIVDHPELPGCFIYIPKS